MIEGVLIDAEKFDDAHGFERESSLNNVIKRNSQTDRDRHSAVR
jgi:hypothetical protein